MEGLKKNFDLDVCKQIHQKLLIDGNDGEFETAHIKITPIRNRLFNSSIPTAKYWTFCFLKLKLYPELLFMLPSDHDDGVFKRLCVPNDNKYMLTSETLCFFGDNRIPPDTCIECTMKYDDVPYSKLDELIIADIPLDNNVSIKDALKVWIGAKCDDHDYEMFLKLKKMGCCRIFLLWCIPGGGMLLGEGQYVDIEKETVDKTFLFTILKYASQIESDIKQVRKIKNVTMNDADFMVPYDDKQTMVGIKVRKNSQWP